MAMMPPQAQPAAQDPAQTDQPQAQPEAAGYEICIRVAGDGTLSVGVESPQEEAAEGAQDESNYKPAANIKEALTMALEMFKNDGQMPDEGAGDQEFSSGFKSRGY